MKISRKQLSLRDAADKAPSTSSRPSLRLDEWLPYQCFLPAQHTARLLGEFYGPRFGISQNAWRILATIADRPGANARQICVVLGMDAVSVSRGIAQLVETGFAQRDAAENDRRYASVTVTPRGRVAFDEIATVGLEIEKRMLATLTDPQRAVLRDALLAIGRESERMANSGWQRLLFDAVDQDEQTSPEDA